LIRLSGGHPAHLQDYAARLFAAFCAADHAEEIAVAALVPPIASQIAAVPRPPLSSALRQNIVDFLLSLPHVHDHKTRQALLFDAGLDASLQQRIDIEGAPGQFFSLLVQTLEAYGCLSDGRMALAALLEAAQESVGKDRQAVCAALLQQLQ